MLRRLVGVLHPIRQCSDGSEERVELVVHDVLHDGAVGVEGAMGEVVAQAGFTTIANLAHGVTEAPLDERFKAQEWERVGA